MPSPVAVSSSPSAPAVAPSPSPSISPTPSKRTTLQQLLPTCQRCRRLRRKCDTQLPSCRLCSRAGAECTFYDHALKQTLPRAYVQSLLTRVEHLEAAKRGAAAAALPPPPRPDHPADSPAFDLTIPTDSATGKARFWGASSVFALTVELLQHASSHNLLPIPAPSSPGPDPLAGTSALGTSVSFDVNEPLYAPPQAPDADIAALVHLYLVSINYMYCFVDAGSVAAELDTFLALRRARHGRPASPPAPLTPDQTHAVFRITMMCAIACASQARYRPHRTGEALAYFAAASASVEDVTSTASPASLQALLLLCVFCLFFPRKGDIWKLLDYACRLALELGLHTEAEHDQSVADDGTRRSENADEARLRRATFWGLYAIERIVGQLFGRGSDLPETIITTQYPSALSGAGAAEAEAVPLLGGMPAEAEAVPLLGGMPAERAALQEASIAHHYRLVYLRSELFREMYLPAAAPALDAAWLKRNFDVVYGWRRELAVAEEHAGVATLTCDVGYDATVCFLCQPLLLRALRHTARPADGLGDGGASGGRSAASSLEDASGGDGGLGHNSIPGKGSPGAEDQGYIAADPFYSAINLVRTYEKIVRAPERSVLSTYPMTFMSAHYIYLASSTLLSYALLKLDGRTRVMKRMADEAAAPGSDSGGDDAEELDWGAFVDVSSSCLVLLAWCCERWPGMMGMLGPYQQLFRRLVRELIVHGLVT